MLLRLEAIAIRSEAIASRVEAIAIRSEAIASRVEAIATSSKKLLFEWVQGCRAQNGRISRSLNPEVQHVTLGEGSMCTQ